MQFKLDGLDPRIAEKTREYAGKILELHGANIVSISLYGSSITEEYVKGKSNLNLLFILARIDPPDLKKSHPTVKKYSKKGIVSLFMTEDHIKTSTDVFPVEFLEMKENHRTIYGKDIFDDLEIENTNIRLQCEQVLKGSLIRMYQMYLETGDAPKKLMKYAVDSIMSFFPVFRNLLRLAGMKPPVSKRETVIDLCNRFGLDGSIWLNVLKIKEGKMKGEEVETLFLDYIEQMEHLGLIVDKMEVKK